MKKFIPILAYHSLDSRRFLDKRAISAELFKKQMLFLNQKRFQEIELKACAQNAWRESFWDQKVALTFDDGYRDNYEVAFPILKDFGRGATFFVVPKDLGCDGFMTWDMVKKIAAVPGMEVGSHSLYHKPLTDIPEKEAWESLVASKKILEDKLGKAIKAVSYPSGSFNEKILEMARGAGYEYGCAASHVHDRKWEGHPLLLRRIKISSSSSSNFTFSLRLSGFYHSFSRP